MNEDHLAGAVENLGGRPTATAGKLVNSNWLVSRGEAHQVSGKLRNIVASIRDLIGLPNRPFARHAHSTSHGDDEHSNPILKKDMIMNKDEIEGGIRSVTGKVEKAVGDVTTDTKWQADGVVDQVAGGAQQLYGRAKDKVRDVIDDAPDALADAGERVRDVAQRGRTLADDQVRDNPWLLVAAAGVAGYALSWMLHGRRD